MVEFQKFQFDNFIIGEPLRETRNVSAENITIPAEEEQVEAEEIYSPAEDTYEIEKIETKTYHEEEVSALIKEAEEKSYEKGFKAAQSEIEAQKQRLLEEINNRLLLLVANAKEQETRLENQSLDIASAAIHKLVPVLIKENAQALVKNFLQENFKNIKGESKLAFYINPEMLEIAQGTIADLANRQDFEGKISIHKDNSLAISDCRIVWENGGVERKSNKMLEKVDNLLEENQQKN